MDPEKTFSEALIYGPSGCGKSSLVKAGLPRLSGPTRAKASARPSPPVSIRRRGRNPDGLSQAAQESPIYGNYLAHAQRDCGSNGRTHHAVLGGAGGSERSGGVFDF